MKQLGLPIVQCSRSPYVAVLSNAPYSNTALPVCALIRIDVRYLEQNIASL